ncbi:cation:proton antiporter [Plantactinospora soyae]|uniref:Kef-type K+ transport system membrane component KefB n=1 Tax=Plantactinospora soyae TaxID=1544732 RepID=A0A927MDQ1_9ACTN|nr:cation:proton antiporter [Plantactinospora soyae]MBE1489205.1 Kef-type K+ transport system membrane component KefB [Plantactinospora soyae]
MTLAPPLGAHQLLIFLLAVATLLLLARCLGWLAQRVGMPALVGELLTGVFLGPSLLGWVAPDLSGWLLPAEATQMHLLDAIGQFGVLLLVGVTGAHLDIGLLRRRAGTVVRVSLGGLLIPLSFGIALGALLPSLMETGDGGRLLFAVFLGVAMCVSAIPVIAKTLSDMRLLHRNVGQLILLAGTLDDVVGWFLLSVVSAAAVKGVSAGQVSLSLLYLVGFIVFAVLAGRPVVRRVMRIADRSEDGGPSVATAVVVILLGAVCTHALGMEPVFGAFVAGILIGLPGAANQIKLASLRTLVTAVLAPIFLATAGLRMDLTALVDPTVALAALAVLVIAILGKFAGAYIGARLSRLSRWEGLAIGAGMNARGVVEVIIALTGLRLGVLNTVTYTIVVLVAIVTSLMAPPILRYAVSRLEQGDDERLREIEQEAWRGIPGTQPSRDTNPASGPTP